MRYRQISVAVDVALGPICVAQALGYQGKQLTIDENHDKMMGGSVYAALADGGDLVFLACRLASRTKLAV